MANENMGKLNMSDDDKSNHLLQTFMQWCNSVENTPEDSQQVHEKMIALLTQKKFTMTTPGPNKENLNIKHEKFRALIELYEKEIEILQEYISQRKEEERTENSKFDKFVQLLNELKSKISSLKETNNSIRTFILLQKKFDELNLQISQCYQTPDKASTSDKAD